jgi:hypothetical protein
MKKILLLAAVFCLLQSIPASADDELVPPIDPGTNTRSENLISSSQSTLVNKVNELERRVNDLERDRRFNQDRIRQLDREVNDMKRRF